MSSLLPLRRSGDSDLHTGHYRPQTIVGVVMPSRAGLSGVQERSGAVRDDAFLLISCRSGREDTIGASRDNAGQRGHRGDIAGQLRDVRTARDPGSPQIFEMVVSKPNNGLEMGSAVTTTRRNSGNIPVAMATGRRGALTITLDH